MGVDPSMTTAIVSANRWLICRKPRTYPLLRLLAVPPGGSGAGLYHGWDSRLPSWVEVWCVNAPGRDSRVSEPAPRNLGDHVAAITAALRPLGDVPLTIFGHSMGGFIAFEVARRLLVSRGPRPLWLFLSSVRAPSLGRDYDSEHILPDEDLIAAVRHRYGGLPPEIEQYPELLEMALGVLRRDLQAFEEYVYRPAEPIPVSITALGADSDPSVPIADLEPWSAETSAGFNLKVFPGTHCYVDTCRSSLLAFLRDELRSLVRSRSQDTR